MRTAVFFLFVLFISCACLETALGAKHPFLLYAIGFGVWVPFVRYCNYVIKKRADRQQREQAFQDFMRWQSRNGSR